MEVFKADKKKMQQDGRIGKPDRLLYVRVAHIPTLPSLLMKEGIDYDTWLLLNKQNWDEILLVVEASVIKVLRLASDSDNLPKGLQPRDLAFEAMMSLFSGERRWDSNRYPNLAKFMIYSIVRSKLSHLYNSSHSKLVSRLVEEALPENHDQDEHVLGENDSQALGFSFEEEFVLQDMVEKVLMGLKADKVAAEVFKLRLESFKDHEIAAVLEISVDNVRAANKRLARIGEKMLPRSK